MKGLLHDEVRRMDRWEEFAFKRVVLCDDFDGRSREIHHGFTYDAIFYGENRINTTLNIINKATLSQPIFLHPINC